MDVVASYLFKCCYVKKLLLFFPCIFFLLVSCQKEKLPKLTEEGKNTFGCKINGKNWVPHGTGSFGGSYPIFGGFINNGNTIYIVAYNDRESIEFYLENVFSEGEYLLDLTTIPRPDDLHPKNYGMYIIGGSNNTIPNQSFITTALSTGKVNITNLDTTKKIVSGTFEFIGVDKNNNTKKITDGRFDVKTH